MVEQAGCLQAKGGLKVCFANEERSGGKVLRSRRHTSHAQVNDFAFKQSKRRSLEDLLLTTCSGALCLFDGGTLNIDFRLST